MEVFLRCEIPDVPGRLATLAGAIGESGGDIQAVEVVQRTPDTVIDDLWVQTRDLATMVEHIEALEDTAIVHTGPSRGLPGDAVARLSTGIDALLSGAMSPEDGLPTLIGGLLFADSAELVEPHEWPTKRNRRVLRLQVVGGVLVLRREYRFLDAEIQRAHQVLTVCERAAAIAAGHVR
ncbi:hypothetical protein [Euzebya sp.]|uniref:hypothetical protein n=1 Tax=Euzebya sp. TaxID=1971409 RepID=UPI00351165DC